MEELQAKRQMYPLGRRVVQGEFAHFNIVKQGQLNPKATLTLEVHASTPDS